MMFSLPGRRAVKQAWGKETFKYGKETLKSIMPLPAGGPAEYTGRLAEKYFLWPHYNGDRKYITLVYDFCAVNHKGHCTDLNFHALKTYFNVFLDIRVKLPGNYSVYDTLEYRNKIINALGVTPVSVPAWQNKGYVANFFIEIAKTYISRHVHN